MLEIKAIWPEEYTRSQELNTGDVERMDSPSTPPRKQKKKSTSDFSSFFFYVRSSFDYNKIGLGFAENLAYDYFFFSTWYEI